jgi:hypothetical protein
MKKLPFPDTAGSAPNTCHKMTGVLKYIKAV